MCEMAVELDHEVLVKPHGVHLVTRELMNQPDIQQLLKPDLSQ